MEAAELGDPVARRAAQLDDRSYRAKRLFDLGVLLVLAPFAVPIGLVCAVAVALTSRGPTMFRQSRVGHHGTIFTILKFRTMIDNPDGNELVPDPTQITAVGRVLRRTSLDEVPQLLNVLWGDMSLVGPRPTLPYQVERYDDRQLSRLAVRPGVTCLAQVEGRNALPWAERIDKDLDYIERSSPWFDLVVLARSIPAVLDGTGVVGHPADDPLAAGERDSSAGS